MEDKDLQLFYSGLDYAFEGTGKEPAPLIPDGWGRFVFTSVLIDLSFYHILFELIKDCMLDILESVVNLLEEMDVYKDTDRLRLLPGQLYESLSSLSYTHVCFLLEKIDCTDGDYEELVIASIKKNKSKFVEILKGYNSIVIHPKIRGIRFLQSQEKLFKMSKNIAFGYQLHSRDVSFDELLDFMNLSSLPIIKSLDEFSRLIAIRRKELTELIGNLKEKKNNNDVWSGFDDGSEYDNVLCSIKYFTFFSRYCRLLAGGKLNAKTKMAFEFLFTLPAVRGLYDEGLECWKKNSWGEKMSELESRLQDNTTDEGKKSINDSETPTLQNEEPVSKESISTIGDATWHLPIDFFADSYLDTCDENTYFPGFLEHIINLVGLDENILNVVRVQLNKLFEDFINWLAREGYIENTSITKSSFAHTLTGRKVDGKTIKVTWKRAHKGSGKQNDWGDNISYMVNEFYFYKVRDKNYKTIRKFDRIRELFVIEEGNELFSVGSSYAKYVDKDFRAKVDRFVKGVDRLAKELGISPEKDLL